MPFQSLPDQFAELFGSTGSTFEGAIATTRWLQDLPDLPSDVWGKLDAGGCPAPACAVRGFRAKRGHTYSLVPIPGGHLRRNHGD